MGYLREPKGVDFTVIPVELTEKDLQEISAFIAESKRKNKTRFKKIVAEYQSHLVGA